MYRSDLDALNFQLSKLERELKVALQLAATERRRLFAARVELSRVRMGTRSQESG